MKTETSIFYISSRGFSATTWLAKMLSRHPQVVCFHSTRTFPPYSPSSYYPEMSPDDFMEGLMECGRVTRGEKIFGSAHGYYGMLAKEACEKRGGKFSYIIRHPISRVHSGFISYLDEYYKRVNVPVENKDIHDRICSEVLAGEDLMKYVKAPALQGNQGSRGFKNSLKQIAKKLLPDLVVKMLVPLKWSPLKRRSKLKEEATRHVPEKDFAGRLFVSLADDFLGHDYQLLEGCSTTCGIKMEEMVKSPEYFKNHVWPLVAPEIDVTDAYLKSIFSEKRFNVHRDIALTPKEIWGSWPQGMKDVFMKYFEQYNISTLCKAFDYDVSFL